MHKWLNLCSVLFYSRYIGMQCGFRVLEEGKSFSIHPFLQRTRTSCDPFRLVPSGTDEVITRIASYNFFCWTMSISMEPGPAISCNQEIKKNTGNQGAYSTSQINFINLNTKLMKNSVHNCGHNTPLYRKAKINFVFSIWVEKHKMKRLRTVKFCLLRARKETKTTAYNC